MSKHYKYVLIQKVTFATKKNSWHSLVQENPISTHKNLMLTPIKQCCIYTSISLSTQRLSVSTQYLPFTTTFSWLAKLSCVLIDFSVSTQDFLVSACVKSFFCWGSYFLDKNMFTSSYWFDIVFWNSFQYILTICRTKVGLLCKTKLHHLMIDGVSLILELIYIQKFQKAAMSILHYVKSYYVKNSV